MLVLALLLAGCDQTAADSVVEPPAVTDAPMPSPSKTPFATDRPRDPTRSQATLTIIRSFPAAMGEFTITAAVPLFFDYNPNDPEAPTDFIGYATGTATLNTNFVGPAGSYPVTGEWPVKYAVDGVLTPRRDVCRLTLNVQEMIFASTEVLVVWGPLGEIPMTAGEDVLTAFSDLQFTEIETTVTRSYPGTESLFTLEDLCLAKETHCIYACPP